MPPSNPEAISSSYEDLITCKSDRAAKKAVQIEEHMKKLAENESKMEVSEAVEEQEGEEQDWEDIADDSDLMGKKILLCLSIVR